MTWNLLIVVYVIPSQAVSLLVKPDLTSDNICGFQEERRKREMSQEDGSDERRR